MYVTHVNSHIVYMKLGDDISLLNFKIVVAKTLIGKYSNWSPLLGWASEKLMNHPWAEKSQPACPSSSRSEWDVIIARMKAQISNLVCPIRHVACTYDWRKREIVFWSIICSFPSGFHSLLCILVNRLVSVDCLASYCVFYVVEYSYIFWIW